MIFICRRFIFRFDSICSIYWVSVFIFLKWSKKLMKHWGGRYSNLWTDRSINGFMRKRKNNAKFAFRTKHKIFLKLHQMPKYTGFAVGHEQIKWFFRHVYCIVEVIGRHFNTELEFRNIYSPRIGNAATNRKSIFLPQSLSVIRLLNYSQNWCQWNGNERWPHLSRKMSVLLILNFRTNHFAKLHFVKNWNVILYEL